MRNKLMVLLFALAACESRPAITPDIRGITEEWHGEPAVEIGEMNQSRCVHLEDSHLVSKKAPSWRTIPSEQPYALFGSSVAIGDTNGDGYDDVLVGAPRFHRNGATEATSTDPGYEAGSAFLYFGSVNGPEDSPLVFEEPDTEARAWFGDSVAVADIDGDGADEVVVAATNRGGISIFQGAEPMSPALLQWTTEMARGQGEFPSWEVVSAGDVNGDGYDDLLVGLYTSHAVRMIFGSAHGLGGVQDLPQPVGDWWGWSIAAAGDLNGDGYDDLVVGATRRTDNIPLMRIHQGSTNGLLTEAREVLAPSAVFDTWFGSSIAAAGDLNGDGYDDVVQGIYGLLVIYLGNQHGFKSGISVDDPGEQVDTWFGSSIAAAGDLNGDGYDDLVVGARWQSSEGRHEGRTYIYTWGEELGFEPGWSDDPSNQDGAQFGSVVASGDLNGDGHSDLVVAAPFHSDPEEGQGRVYFYLGGHRDCD